jgi:PAS domain S-box-containing protein
MKEYSKSNISNYLQKEIPFQDDDLLRAITEATTDHIYVKNAKGKFIMINSSAANFLGKTPEEIIGRDDSDFFPPDSVNKIREHDLYILNSGETQTYEEAVVVEGITRIFLAVKAPYRDRNKAIIGIIGISRDITERKVLEEKLRTEHAFRKPIEDSILAGISAVDLEGRIIYVNPAFCKLVGWNEEELIGSKTPFVFWPPEEVENIQKLFREHLKGNRLDPVELQLCRRTGERFFVESLTANLTDGHGNTVGKLSSVYDITLRKKSEEMAIRSEQRLQQAISASQIGIFEHDHLTDKIYCSPEVRNIYGFGLTEEVTLATIINQIYPMDRERIGKAIQASHDPAGDGTFKVDHRIVRGDREIRWVTTQAQTFFIGEGNGRNHLRTVGSVLDITERKRIEEALRSKEEQLVRSQQIAHLGSWELDLGTNQLIWSDEVFRIFELDPHKCAVSYEAFMNAVHPDDREYVNNAYTTSVKEHSGYSLIHRLLISDGRIKYVHEIGETFYSSEGEPLRSVGTVQDITARKNLEDELIKAQKLDSLGVLAGGIAHDFNNVLVGILGNISLVTSSLNPNDQSFKLLMAAEKASLRAKDLSSRLLTFSKGGIPIKKVSSINTLLEHTIQFALTGSNVKSKIFLEEGLWSVEIDEGQIGQVIQNLVINAQQAMPKGGSVIVKARNMMIGDNEIKTIPLRNGNYLEITIQDEGMGIPNELLSKIFDPYFTTKQRGSGLGLAITYSIVQRHSGFINVRSEVGNGTTFYLYLPASTSVSIQNETLKESLSMGKGKVLVVDDEESVLNVAREMLRHLGFEATVVLSGTEGLETFKTAKETKQSFDVVITDLTIPGDIGGLEIVKKLKKLDRRVKVIVSTGYSNDPAISNFKSYGFTDFILKPYRLFELSSVLNRVLIGS